MRSSSAISVLLVAASFFICAARARAGTYYVSPGGDDAAAGTSPATPWKTLSHVSALDAAGGLPAGSVVLLARGGFWAEAAPLVLGPGGNSLTIGAYGSNVAPPTISGAQMGGVASMTAICLDVQRANCSVNRIRFESAFRGVRFDSGNLTANGAEVRDCYFADMDNRTNYQTPCYGILLEGTAWQDVVIDSCVFDHVTTGVATLPGSFFSSITINNCEAFGGWGPGFFLKSIHGGILANSRVHDVGGLAAAGTSGCLLDTCQNVTIMRCSFSRVAHGGGYDGVGIDFESGNMLCTVSETMIFDNEGSAIAMLSGTSGTLANTGIMITDSYFYNNNTQPHVDPNPPGANSTLHQSGAQSTGQIINCGLYWTAGPPSVFGGNWSGFQQTNVTVAPARKGWIPVLGDFTHISVGGSGHIAALDANGAAYEWNGSLFGDCWTQTPASVSFTSLGIGRDGDMVALSSAGSVYHRTSGSWVLVNGMPTLSKVAVGSARFVWGIGASGRSYSLDIPGNTFVLHAPPQTHPITDIDVGNAGEVWGLSGSDIMQYNAPNWTVATGAHVVPLSQISCHGSVLTEAIVAGVDSTGAPVRTIDTWDHKQTLTGSGFVEVSEGSDGTLWALDTNNHVWRSR